MIYCTHFRGSTQFRNVKTLVALQFVLNKMLPGNKEICFFNSLINNQIRLDMTSFVFNPITKMSNYNDGHFNLKMNLIYFIYGCMASDNWLRKT